MNNHQSAAAVVDLQPDATEFLSDVVTGMQADPKHLPCKYLYDERGSRLFDEICELDEYYLTRSEDQIIKEFAAEMAEQLGPGVMLVEYGSGSSTKTRALLDELISPSAYVPVDISREHLRRTADDLAECYPHIEVLPVCADFTQPFSLPNASTPPTHAAVFFPGSTIGNFRRSAARRMLTRIAGLCGRGGGLLIGIDLQKDVEVIESAYNDSAGVTAEFNVNLLRHINRELGADFVLEDFLHRAVYDEHENRVEISLVSQCEQSVAVGGRVFPLDRDEAIVTEYSHKYTIDGFARLAAEAGLTLRRTWTDEDELFAVLHFALLS